MTGYLARDFLAPRTFIFSSNAESLVVQSTASNTKIALLNATAANSLDPIFYLDANNDVFNITKNNSNIATYDYRAGKGYLSVDQFIPQKILLDDRGTISYSNDAIFFGLSHCNVSLGSIKYDTAHQEALLDIRGSIYAAGTVYASNLTIYGDSIIIDAVTSNSEQVVITNLGSGPALSVTQLGEEHIAVFYDDSNLSLIVADGGYIGIGTTFPKQPLDVYGNATISSYLGIGTAYPANALHVIGDIQLTGTILQNGSNFFDNISDWKKDLNSNLYYTSGNVGIGTSQPTERLDVNGTIKYSSQLVSTTTTQPPFSVSSSQLVNNLNAEFIAGRDETFLRSTPNLIGLIEVSQGGTGSNYLTPNALLVSASNKVISPSELFWNDTTKRLGINTNIPAAPLHVAGNLFLENTLTFPEFVVIYAASNAVQMDQLRVSSNLGIGIASNIPVSLYINKPDAIRLPSGTTADRPLPQAGYIRYNTTTQQFEGYTNEWEVLNRVQNIGGSTSIYPDTALHFYTSNLERVTIDINGNVGIGSTTPILPLDIYKTDAISLPRGTLLQRPAPFPGAIRYNLDHQQFEGYTSEWTVLSGLRSPDQFTYITATNDSNLSFYTGTQLRATIDSLGNVGIGTTLPQAQLHVQSDIIAKSISTSNYTVFQNFSYSPDGTVVRTHYQINPGRSNILLTTSTSNFSLTLPGIYAVPPENIEIHQDGIKVYAFTSSYINQQTTTKVDIALQTPALSNQTIDILAWPNYLDPTNALLLPGYVIQNLTYSYWEQANANSNLFYTQGNVGIGTTQLPATFNVYGDSLFQGPVTIASNQGLFIASGPSRVYGSTSAVRIETTIDNNNPTLLLENSNTALYKLSLNTENTLQLAADNNALLQLTPTSFSLQPNTFIGSVSTVASNTLDVSNTLALGSYAGQTTAPNHSLIVSGNIGIGTTYPRQSLEVTLQSSLLGNVGIGTTLPRTALDVLNTVHVAGQIGIRTTEPLAPLHIAGNTYTSGNIGFGTLPTTSIDLWLTQEPSITQDAIRLTTSTHDISTTDITATAITMRMIEPTGDLLLTPMARIAYGNRHGTNLYGVGYENNGVLMFDTASAGTLGTRMLLAATGIGIGTTLPRARLDVDGTTRTDVLTVVGNLGIGTTVVMSPSILQVEGKQYISQALGIATATPREALDVMGNSLFSSNVGIGTTFARTQLDVIGTIIAASNLGIGTIAPVQALHVTGQSYFSSNVGIGTALPRAMLDLDPYTLLAGNVGINSLSPQARLDIKGDATLTRLGVNILPRDTLDVNGNAIVSGSVGINTTVPVYPFHIQGTNTLTVSSGKLCIKKGSLPVAANSEIEIQSSDTNYSGLLLRNDGNFYPSPAIRINSYHYDNDASAGYAANIGLARMNDNAVIGANTPLGAIHFGGNHTNSSLANLAYNASIQGIAESDFTNSSSASTGLAFFTGSNAYSFVATTIHPSSEVMRITATRRVGIHTTLPDALLTIQGSNNAMIPFAVHSSKAILLPVGSNSDRPSGQLGLIRYNTEYQQFEGFGGGNSWGSLGGVRSIAGDTYILAEYTPGNNDQNLHFYTAGTEKATLTPTGNLGIGVITPTEKLHVEGNTLISGTLTTSNLTVLGTMIIDAVASNLEQVVIINHGTGPALSVTQTGVEPIATFYDGDTSNQVVTIANNGNVGIGTTQPAYGLHVYRDVAYGSGLGGSGCYHLQQSWDSVGTNHTIYYPNYCIGSNSSGMLQIQVKGGSKLGSISMSFLKATSSLDLFSIYYHKTSDLATMAVSVANSSNILVQTDSDCSIAWQSTGAI